MKAYDVFCLGHALIDVVAEVDDEHILGLNLRKGNTTLIDSSTFSGILKLISQKEKRIVPAGSAANTAMGVAALGGKSVFAGKIGNDINGNTYHSIISKKGVLPALIVSPGVTGSCISMVTPDSERTMTTFLGVSSAMMKHELDVEKLRASNILHIEGYQWNEPHQQETATHAMEVARENDIKVSFDLGDPSLVERNRGVFRQLLKNRVDIAFANEEEAMALTGKKSPEEAILVLGDLCETAVVKMGEKGSIISNSKALTNINAFKATAVDTTGAGDLYAAGLLYGLSKGLSIEDSGLLGSFVASKIVAQYGAMPPETVRSDVEAFLGKNFPYQKNL